MHPFLLSYRALIVTLVAVLMLATPFASAGASMAPVPIGGSAVGDREESEEHCDEETDGCCESAEAADDCSEGGDCGPECGGGCLCCLSTALLLAGDSMPEARPIDSHPAPVRSGPISSGDPLPFDRPPC